MREPLLVLDHGLRVVTANRAFLGLFRVTREQTEGVAVKDLGRHEWDISVLTNLLKSVADETRSSKITRSTPISHLGPRKMLLNARKIKAADGSNPFILLAIEDITGRDEGAPG